jgi:Glycosyl transferase family 2
MDTSLQLSAILVAGACRKRCQRNVKALCNQTAAAQMEIIIVDMAPLEIPRLETPDGLKIVYLSTPEARLWSEARLEGLKLATAPVVAFIEDHCFPAPTWAAVLIEAHKEPWAAVGYAFVNANPHTYMSRGSMVNDYGFWMHPATGGAAKFLPGSNVSYKRDILLSFGDQLKFMLTPDFNLQETFIKRGIPMCIEPRALAAHQNFRHLPSLMHANYALARLLAARRVRAQSWPMARRMFYLLVTPVSAPVLGVLRLLLSLRGRESLVPAMLAGLPIYTITHAWSAWGESIGYMFGQGSAEEELNDWEISVVRDAD